MNEDTWNRRILILLLALLLPLTLLVMLWLRDFVRESILIPLAYLFWLAGILIRSTPQALFWIIGLLIGLVIAIRSLYAARKPVEEPLSREMQTPPRHRVAFWTVQVKLAREGYSRARFADFFTKLALEVMAFREQASPSEIEERLQRGELSTPPEIAAYLDASRLSSSGEGVNLFAWLIQSLRQWLRDLAAPGRKARAPTHREELKTALGYLEDLLEIKHDA